MQNVRPAISEQQLKSLFGAKVLVHYWIFIISLVSQSTNAMTWMQKILRHIFLLKMHIQVSAKLVLGRTKRTDVYTIWARKKWFPLQSSITITILFAVKTDGTVLIVAAENLSTDLPKKKNEWVNEKQKLQNAIHKHTDSHNDRVVILWFAYFVNKFVFIVDIRLNWNVLTIIPKGAANHWIRADWLWLGSSSRLGVLRYMCYGS